MDSYSFHFERMSNVDLHPLSLPITRLSPAKSNSSIVEQLAHHQHGKGDSAYSSFSGGSTAPDYLQSLHFPEDLQSNSFSHYADLKYIKSIHHPTQVLHSNAKTMDQLYRSMEVISQNYRNSTYNHNGNGSFHTNDKAISKVHFRAPSQGDYPPIGPPPVPARQDSFTATKNLENSKSQHNTDPQKPRPHYHHHPHPHGVIVHQMGTAKPGSSTSVISPELVYSDRRAVPGAEVQQLPSYRSHAPSYEQDRMSMNPPNLFIMDNKASSEQQKSVNFLRQSPPKGISQSEHLKPRHPSSGGGCNGEDHGNPGDVSNEFENPRKRAHSAYDWIESDPAHVSSPWNAGQTAFINSSIQHKGQFYFVTGLCKHSEARMRTHSASVSGSEAMSDCSTVLERPRPKERERCHSTMENLFIPIKEVLDEKGSQSKDLIPRSSDQENHKPTPFSTRSSKSWDSFEEIDTETQEIGRHTTTNPIFYCGPEKNSPHSTLQTKEIPSLGISEPSNQPKQEEQAKRGKRQPLTDVGSDRINKETTPLLYHLTEANRTTLQSQKDAEFSMNDKDAPPKKACVRDVSIKNGKPMQGDATNSGACNTLDDSYKKYYKEKLKDAQSKVLKETSFKRRDLQLASTHCPRPKPEPRSPMIHSFSSSQDSETSTDTLTPSVASDETERGTIVEEVRQSPKQNTETVRENRMSANVAQPQVATRIGGRKRLTPEQKKMCYSEPEKLNWLGGGPSHSACRSFSNESDVLLAVDSEWQDHVLAGEQGLVAARRKLFETRCRALSASSASRTNLKHLQHKALVAYMERKTGQKVAEPQLPGPQQPIPPRQRHSLGEKPFDWGPRPLSASTESSHPRKKLNRPQSAGRILDSSTSSIRYAQFFSAQPSTGQPAGQSNQHRWKERQYLSHGKYASVESLLDQPEPPAIFRNRSTSTPHAFEAQDDKNDPETVNSTEACSVHKSMGSALSSTSEAQQQIRVIAQRGTSMEELEAFKLTRMSAMSKSSEQLDQACRDIRNVSFLAEVREAQGKEWGRKRYGLNPAEKTDISDLKAQTQIDTQKKSSLKHNSDPAPVDGEDVGLNPTTGRRTLSGSHSPTSCSSSRGKRQSSGSRSPPTDKFLSSKPPIEAPSYMHSCGDPETIEKGVLSTLSSTTQIKQPSENRPSSRGIRSSSEQSVVEAGKDAHKVSLSCGVTTDPSLWILPSEEEQPKEDVQTPDSVFDKPAILHLPCQTSETSVSACVSVSDQQVANEKNSKTEDKESRENEDIEEKRTPEGETENLESPTKRPQWEELVEAVVKADQSLAPALYPLANRKTALMLMEQLLSEDTLLMEEHYKKKQEQKGAEESCETEPPLSPDGLKAANREVHSTVDLTDKKSMLVCYIEERLRSLEETRGVLQVEIQENIAHGEALEALVHERCLPLELERYNLFIGDLERVVNLLLCLSARLARVQNALSTVDQDTDVEEKQSLDSRHRLLCKQREDAKDLKDNLDRRESLVSTFLSRQLSAEQVRDYRRFVQTKASLLIRRKDLEEKTRLGEEQLEALTKSLCV
ncbi:protein Shroom1 [Phyllopteryx taeniolatus]|uniref:protein Shroom1 n=1 Tax=Phyllopteryx taeniolatus TaxID=161469 RepID=UPI002AD34AE7|nr:protein Shroom1 [Phyllopteryx taeniolatus]XP_061607960.1 protein Shroom1 [Phyllopteryx taeniolatus]XP_061607961.1 protein Shroom1 [Phyllopteryx taeniolatus]